MYRYKESERPSALYVYWTMPLTLSAFAGERADRERRDNLRIAFISAI